MAIFKSLKKAAQSSNGDGIPEIEVPAEAIGHILRRAREEHGYDLQQVCQVLRIRYVYLDAIEKGHFDRLPGPAYTTGFVRTYADFLGLDPDAVIEQYRRGGDVSAADSALHFPTPKADTPVSKRSLFIVSALVAVLAYAGWHYLSEPRDDGIALVPPLPDRLAALIDAEEGEDLAVRDDAPVALPQSPTVALGEDAELAATPDPVAGTDEPETAAAAAEVSSEPLAMEQVSTPPPNGASASSGAEPEASPETTPPSTNEALDLAPAPESPVQEAANSESSAPETTSPSTSEALDLAPALESPVQEATNSESSAPETTAQDAPEQQAAVLSAAPTQAPGETDTDGLEDLPDPLPELLPSQELPASVPPNPADQDTQTALVSESPGISAQPATQPATPGPEPEVPGIPSVPDGPGTQTATADPVPTVYGEENETYRVLLLATQDSWVQVRDPDGELVLTRVLRAGDSYRVPDRQGMTLLTGNAGGLDIFVDGRKLDVLGPVGAVRRNVDLWPDSLLAQTSGVE